MTRIVAITIAVLVVACGAPAASTPASPSAPTPLASATPSPSAQPASSAGVIPAQTPRAGATAAQSRVIPNIILARWSDKVMGSFASGSIGPGHGIGIGPSQQRSGNFTGAAGMVTSFTGPDGQRHELNFGVPPIGSIEFGVSGPTGLYLLHVETPSGAFDIPITLTQEVIDHQAIGYQPCPTPLPSFTPLVMRFDPAEVRRGETTTLLISGYRSGCEREAVTLGGLAAADGSFFRAAGASAVTVHPAPLRWQVPADIPPGSYTALVYYPLAWREVPLTVR